MFEVYIIICHKHYLKKKKSNKCSYPAKTLNSHELTKLHHAECVPLPPGVLEENSAMLGGSLRLEFSWFKGPRRHLKPYGHLKLDHFIVICNREQQGRKVSRRYHSRKIIMGK